jgi:NADH-quinone oxidoreductase subunit G
VFDGEGAKADVDFGPTLMLNRNRCIMCTRCVRFMRDVEGDAQINIIDRGYGSEIGTFQDEGVYSLISGNLMDVCPVGAITTRDYRFKSRPWDNPNVADTICTQCSKGCNTTAWIKAKPEWAKGSRLIRFTPRFNPDVNGYWMCDIGRFNYHWIEGEDRLQRPLMRDAAGVQQIVSWRVLTSTLRERLAAVGAGDASRGRFLLSAHASNEEFFLFRRLAEELHGPAAAEAITVSWRIRSKVQPAQTKFAVPDVDAPNVNGARLLGLTPGTCGDPQGTADVSALRAAVEAGTVMALYIYDPGPQGSLGDVGWVLDARAADFVLPGASFIEKEASYVNDTGRLQGTARAIPVPGEGMEDWQILVNLSAALGIPFGYASSSAVRTDMVSRLTNIELFSGIAELAFGRPMSARHWLQASNPSERWKWDFMFQDLPPVKGSVDPSSLPLPPGMIPLKELK